VTLGVLAVAAAAASVGAPPCTAHDLSGSFRLVPGSAGAGNVVYALSVRNRSRRTCFVSGLPALTLLDPRGRMLPTHVRAAAAGRLTAVLVRLTPGRSARLTARFSPDVPGHGEGAPGKPCEPKAYELRVAPTGGGRLVVPVRPPTPVCEHGTLSATAFVAG